MGPTEDHARWRAKNRDHLLAYNRARRAALRERLRQQDRDHYARTKDQHREAQQRWKAANLDRVKLMDRAKNTVHRAINKGLLIRPTVCSRCQATAAIEAAHTDYSRPLDITWLCKPCHRAWDAQHPKSKETQ